MKQRESDVLLRGAKSETQAATTPDVPLARRLEHRPDRTRLEMQRPGSRESADPDLRRTRKTAVRVIVGQFPIRALIRTWGGDSQNQFGL